MRNIFLSGLIFIILLTFNGCATVSKPEPFVMQSEKLGIPQAYQFEPEKVSSDIGNTVVYGFEFIIHSEPQGAEVWRSVNDKPVEFLGKTPLALPACIYYSVFNRDRRAMTKDTEIKYFPTDNLNFDAVFIGKRNIDASHAGGVREWNWFKGKIEINNIIIKLQGYEPYILERTSDAFAEWGQLGGTFHPSSIAIIGANINGKSIGVNCSLMPAREKFDEEFSKLIKQNKLKEAEEFRSQRITIFKEAVEREGLQDGYVKELKRLKAMGNLAEPEKAEPKEDLSKDIAKLKDDLDKAITAGDYDKAGKIKELIEYKEKNKPDDSLKGINEKAIKCNNEGLAYARQKYYEDAVKFFKKAIEADPVYIDPYLNLSSCYINLGNMQEAISYAEKVLKLKPDSPVAFYYMGIAYDVLGNHALAVEKYQKALAECAAGECSDDFIVQIKKEGIEGGFFNSIQAARTKSSKSSSLQGFDLGDLLLGALLVGASVDSGK